MPTGASLFPPHPLFTTLKAQLLAVEPAHQARQAAVAALPQLLHALHSLLLPELLVVRAEQCPVLIAVFKGQVVTGGVGIAEPVVLVIKLALQGEADET
jgi:hypothetical protein